MADELILRPKPDDLVRRGGQEGKSLPELVLRAGKAAETAWDDFFQGKLANRYTRAAYGFAVRRFLAWAQGEGRELHQITAGDVGRYLEQHPGSLPTKKQHLSGLRRFFNLLVERHLVIINPALVAETERYQVLEGKTPKIAPDQARHLLASIELSNVVAFRDRAVIGTLIYTAARAGAMGRLRLRDFADAGEQYTFRFMDKRGKSREIPVRHDLEGWLKDYISAAEIDNEPKESPLFRTAVRNEKRLTARAMNAQDICYMMKRRLERAGLPDLLSPHSFRVATATDLLEQGVPVEDVQYLLGHSDPRTTRLYDRREQKVTRNLVERISI
jgi:site-specific recombinase XerD